MFGASAPTATPLPNAAGSGSVMVKVCGVSDLAAISAAYRAGAAYVGFVFFPPSPRAVTAEHAAELAVETPVGLCKVGLFVDPDDKFLLETLERAPLDMIQLHGSESPERIDAVRRLTGLPVMKAVKIGGAEDLVELDVMEEAADQLLCDAKPLKDATLPGGNGHAFDWTLLSGRRWRAPWMLAGGLTPATVAEAIRLTGARQVDVSSGVESAPGVKDAALIEAFIDAAKAAGTPAALGKDGEG